MDGENRGVVLVRRMRAGFHHHFITSFYLEYHKVVCVMEAGQGGGGSTLTFFLFRVQLCDTDRQTVHTLLQGVDSEREGVGFIEQLPKQIFCIFTFTEEKQNNYKTIFMLPLMSLN